MKTPEEIRTETKALMKSLDVVERGDDPCVAQEACEDFLKSWVPMDTLEDHVIEAAASRICGRTICLREISGDNELSSIARSWTTWIAGGTPETPEFSEMTGSKLDSIAVQQWGKAVSFLTEDRRDDAQRWFTRATRVSSEYGTESNALIHWAYAASFFH